MSFPNSVEAKALAACNRCCCICHKFCGVKMELHHIKQKADGGKDTFENCIPLCFDCHGDMGKGDPRHPKGKRYSDAELILHRDKWYKTCAGKEETTRNCTSIEKYIDEHTSTNEDVRRLFTDNTNLLEYKCLNDNESARSENAGEMLTLTSVMNTAVLGLAKSVMDATRWHEISEQPTGSESKEST